MAKKANKGNKLMSALSKAGSYPLPDPSYNTTAADKARQRRYRAEDALSTLTRAAEIRRDKPLMRDVQKVAQEKLGALKSVTKASGR